MSDAPAALRPWHEGGQEDSLAKLSITVSHDDLLALLGVDTVKIIAEAGFVLVPRQWREDMFNYCLKGSRR